MLHWYLVINFSSKLGPICKSHISQRYPVCRGFISKPEIFPVLDVSLTKALSFSNTSNFYRKRGEFLQFPKIKSNSRLGSRGLQLDRVVPSTIRLGSWARSLGVRPVKQMLNVRRFPPLIGGELNITCIQLLRR